MPQKMLEEYKANERWKYYAKQIRAIEDYPYETGESGLFSVYDGVYTQTHTWEQLIEDGYVAVDDQGVIEQGENWKTFWQFTGTLVLDHSVKRISYRMFDDVKLTGLRITEPMNIHATALIGNALEVVDMGYPTGIDGGCFSNSPRVESAIIRTKNVVPLSKVFTQTASSIQFYVPERLVEDYRTATNWSVYADRILAIEDNLDICAL